MSPCLAGTLALRGVEDWTGGAGVTSATPASGGCVPVQRALIHQRLHSSPETFQAAEPGPTDSTKPTATTFSCTDTPVMKFTASLGHVQIASITTLALWGRYQAKSGRLEHKPCGTVTVGLITGRLPGGWWEGACPVWRCWAAGGSCPGRSRAGQRTVSPLTN